MPRCVVKSCVYNKSANCVKHKQFLHLFRFPKDYERREVWRIALNLKKEDVFTSSNVCHKHFTDDSFALDKSPFSLHLKQSAVPNLSTQDESLPSSATSITDTSVTMIDLDTRPSTTTGFYEESYAPQLQPRSSTSLRFSEEKTPIPNLNLSPKELKLRKQLTGARTTIKRLRTSLSYFKKRVVRLTAIIKSLSGTLTDETLETNFCLRQSLGSQCSARLPRCKI